MCMLQCLAHSSLDVYIYRFNLQENLYQSFTLSVLSQNDKTRLTVKLFVFVTHCAHALETGDWDTSKPGVLPAVLAIGYLKYGLTESVFVSRCRSLVLLVVTIEAWCVTGCIGYWLY